MKTIDDLCTELTNMKCTVKCLDGSTYDTKAIRPEAWDDVMFLIRQFFLDQHDSELGELRAKCYAYEKIIANSNFAPVLELKKDDGSGIVLLNKNEDWYKEVTCGNDTKPTFNFEPFDITREDFPRTVRCCNNDINAFGGADASVLEVNNYYTAIAVDVHGYYSLVYLEGFPDGFNSCNFEEV